MFLDTSSLFKLYHQEKDSSYIESIFNSEDITAVFLSELTKVEFFSTVWKKVRLQEITEPQAKILIESFKDDFNKYVFVEIDKIVIEQAGKLLLEYGSQGLRTLDSIQLATAVSLKDSADLFLTADTLLNSFFKQEVLLTEIK